MNKLTCIESRIEEDQTHYGCFLIEPLEVGQGITLGNALRRTILSDLSGFAVTGVRINDLKHEFAVLESLREDILEVLLNLKELKIKSSLFSGQSEQKTKYKGCLSIKGPAIITAGMFDLLPKDELKILNPDQYIATLIDDSKLNIEIDIEKGKGYRLAEENLNEHLDEKFSPLKPSTLLLDAIFMPVKKMNYKIKIIHDSQGNIKESLQLEIITNGSITPKRSILESLKLIIHLICPLFLDSDFLGFLESSELLEFSESELDLEFSESEFEESELDLESSESEFEEYFIDETI